MALEPVTLSGRHVELVPLSREHRDALAEAVRDGELWRLWYTAIPSPEAMAAEIDRRLGLQAAGRRQIPAVLLPGRPGDPQRLVVGLRHDQVDDEADHRPVALGRETPRALVLIPGRPVDDDGNLVGWAMFHLTGSEGSSHKQLLGYFAGPLNPEDMAIVNCRAGDATCNGVNYGAYIVKLID